MRAFHLAAGLCVSLIGLFGCQRNTPSPPTAPAAARPPELAGRWQLTLPAGAKHEVIVENAAEGRFLLTTGVRFGGLYEIQGGRLVIVEPTLAGNEGSAWEIRGPDEMV